NSIMAQTPRLSQAIADGMGVGIGELKNLGAEGKLTAGAVFNAIQSQADKLNSEFEKMPLTVGQSITNVKNSILSLVGEIEKSSESTEGLAVAIQFWSKAIDDNIDSIVEGFKDAYRGLELMGLGIMYVGNGFNSVFLALPLTVQMSVEKVLIEIEDFINNTIKTTEQGVNKLRDLIGKEAINLGSIDISSGWSKQLNEDLKNYEDVLKTGKDIEKAIAKTYAEIMTDTTAGKRQIIAPSDVKGTKATSIKTDESSLKKIIDDEKKAYSSYLSYIDDSFKAEISNRYDREIYIESKKYRELLEKHSFTNGQIIEIEEAFSINIARIEREKTEEQTKIQRDALYDYYDIIDDKVKAGEIQLEKYKESLKQSGLDEIKQAQMIAKTTRDLEIKRLVEQLTLNEKYYEAINDWQNAELMRTEKLKLEYEKQGYSIKQINEMINGSKVGKTRQDNLYKTLSIDNAILSWQSNIDVISKYREQELSRLEAYYGKTEEMTVEHTAKMRVMDSIRFTSALAIAQTSFSSLTSLAKQFYDLSDGESKSAARAYQTVAATEAVISTYLSAQKAYESAGNPYLGAVMAGIATAQGLMRVAAIKKEKFHSGGVVSGKGEVDITALGGEGVVSHQGMSTLAKLNLDKLNSGNVTQSPQELQITIINVSSREEAYEAMRSRTGKKIINEIVNGG
ncbi:MAG: tape measure protein, partial [Campylobacteraceae bacterium]